MRAFEVIGTGYSSLVRDRSAVEEEEGFEAKDAGALFVLESKGLCAFKLLAFRVLFCFVFLFAGAALHLLASASGSAIRCRMLGLW